MNVQTSTLNIYNPRQNIAPLFDFHLSLNDFFFFSCLELLEKVLLECVSTSSYRTAQGQVGF